MASGSEPVKNIVLVGRAGNGKSATGNSIIRRQIFTSGTQATGVTMTCQTFRAVTLGDSIINVIDTPEEVFYLMKDSHEFLTIEDALRDIDQSTNCLFDLITKPDVISKEIVRCLALAEGLHAVVLVLSVRTRITKEEEDSLCTLQILFGARILNYLIVVFTGGDELDCNNQTLETYLSECPPFLKNIFILCGHRKVLFNNRTDDEDQKNRQIQELLDHVAAIGRRNGGIPFTERMHRQIKEETIRLRKEEKEAEAKFLATEIEQVKKKLNEEHEHKMSEMAKTVEDVIRHAWEEQQRMIRVIEYLGPRKTCNIM